jgi:hypothetical protein
LSRLFTGIAFDRAGQRLGRIPESYVFMHSVSRSGAFVRTIVQPQVHWKTSDVRM